VTRLEKLEAKLVANPPEARYADVRNVLEAHGWVLDRDPAGSHFTFAKEDDDVHGQVFSH
jgi:predicted RNA binding protein YcfA (HicA-like mRNA interferase family)